MMHQLRSHWTSRPGLKIFCKFARTQPISHGLWVPHRWRGSGRRSSAVYRSPLQTRYHSSGSLTLDLKTCWIAYRSYSAVFYVDLRIDAAGVPLDRDLVLPKLRSATNAPIFSYIDSYLGSGIVGGPMLSSEEVGRRMAEAAVRILRGESPGDLKIPPVAPGVAQYDWRELQHWKISEKQLPAGSVVRFREPYAWEKYRWQIALVSAIVLVQGGLISGLL